MFRTSFFWKWPASCHIFVKWPVGQQQLDRAALVTKSLPQLHLTRQNATLRGEPVNLQCCEMTNFGVFDNFYYLYIFYI